MRNPDDPGVAAVHLLHALGREMAEMAVSSERLQTILVSACAFAPEGNRRFLNDAQACDLLTQKLINLAEFMDVIAQAVPDEWTIDIREACRGVSLSDLARGLRLEPSIRSEKPGELDLFD